jgi:hypothetical protein
MTGVDRIPLIKQPATYQSNDDLLADLGLDHEPQGVKRDGARPEVPRPSNRSGTGTGPARERAAG